MRGTHLEARHRARRFKELADGMGMMRPKKASHKAVKATAMATEADLDTYDTRDDQSAPESKHSATPLARERAP